MLKNENYDKKLLIGLVITVLLLGSFSFLMFNETTRMAEVAEQYKTESLLRGRELFVENCSSCHGTRGEGIVGPTLNDKALLEEAEDGVLFATIQTGRPNTTMPAWGQAYGGALTDEDIHDIVNFIRAFEPTAPQVETPPQTSDGETGLDDAEIAAQAFQKGGCGACHVIPGVPNAVGTIGPDLSQIGAVAEEYLQSGEYSGDAKTVEEFLNESVVDPDVFIPTECPGDNCQEGLMPATFGELLSEQELEAVVSFLASLPSDAAETADQAETAPVGETEAPVLSDEELAKATQIFFERCAGCHGVLRNGATGPALTPAQTLAKGTVALTAIIFNGTPRGMPDWGKQGVLTEKEAELLAKFIQNEPPQPPGDVP